MKYPLSPLYLSCLSNETFYPPIDNESSDPIELDCIPAKWGIAGDPCVKPGPVPELTGRDRWRFLSWWREIRP